MRILAVEHAIPSREISNAWILEKIREENSSLPRERLIALEEQVTGFLASAGTVTRYWLGEGERAIDLAVQAGREALRQSGVSAEQVDFVIYVGVGRGWLEPATANVVQAALGLENATGFDVLDACASWLRALQIAHSLLRGGSYRRGMIVNCECGFFDGFADWRMRSAEEVECRLATCTIGEAATATVVDNQVPEDDFHFVFRNFGEHAQLCMIPLGNVKQFWNGPIDDRYVPFKFFSLSRELMATALRKVVETFRADPRLHAGRYDICFTHAASEKAVETAARRLGMPLDIYFSTHPRYGNTVSASIPLGLSLASKERRLRRGDKVLAAVAASGITVGIATFTF